MDNINKLKDMLLELPEIKSAEHIKSVESAVTTAWGEEVWDHYKLSRDCLQNAVDGCVESNVDIDQIKITTDNDQIKVFAPTNILLKNSLHRINKIRKRCSSNRSSWGRIKGIFWFSRIGIFNPVLLSGEQALIVTVGKESQTVKTFNIQLFSNK